MINLLPPEEKEELLSEKKKRIVMIFWVLVLFFLFCFILILFSVRIYFQSQAESQKALLLEAEKEFGQSEFQELREKINSINLSLTKLDSFYQQETYFSEVLEKVSKTLPQYAFFTNISVVPSAEEEFDIKVSLSGFVPTRGALFEFKKNLEKESNFQEIYFPPANWVKPTDIDFFITFKIDSR